ncbi:colanic acid/amylovoran biosynthesis glycosyltransferase [Flavobacteriaceae bacterium MAR_2010_105]|nr:colanic acid/amylovoran biosynthesis glycosyltransferase [Flavobacteriaceae bacterium MAR_2010_105]
MNIGLVLSKPPAYSETFFMSKIKGLELSGHKVVLYVQYADRQFSSSKVVCAPKFYKRHYLWQCLAFLKIGFSLLPFIRRVAHFMQLEHGAQRSWKRSFKNLYLNAHILQADLDWLHFGFATMAVDREHIAQAIGAKMAVSFRGYDIDVYPLKFPNCYNLLWTQVDKVHSISQYLLDKAYGLGLARTTAYQIITPAIDLESFNTFRREPRKLNGIVKFISIARFEWIKGLDYTLEALALLKAKGVNFHYSLIGEGKGREALVYGISQLGLQEQVRLINQIPHEEVVDYLLQSDIYIQYSHSEGFCNAVLEAQAVGCLCVVSDGGALGENVVHGQTGWVIDKRQPELLAQTLNKIIELTQDERSKMISNAQDHIKQHFDIASQQQAFRQFYEFS